MDIGLLEWTHYSPCCQLSKTIWFFKTYFTINTIQIVPFIMYDRRFTRAPN